MFKYVYVCTEIGTRTGLLASGASGQNIKVIPFPTAKYIWLDLGPNRSQIIFCLV